MRDLWERLAGALRARRPRRRARLGLITLMTAGLVAGIWAIAGPTLNDLFTRPSKVSREARRAEGRTTATLLSSSCWCPSS